MNNLLTCIRKLSVYGFSNPVTRNISTTATSWLKTTSILMAEPLKKKKRIDPAVVKAREDRKRKKIEKQIRRLEKNARQLKPIDEVEVPLTLMDERTERSRLPPIHSREVLEKSVLLEKMWARYKHNQHMADIKMVDRMFMSQQKALFELRKVSDELYNAAVKIDPTLLPYTTRGPVTTPALKDYGSPDGDYHDVSKKWD